MMKYHKLLPIAVLALALQACTGFIFRIDVPQGNFLQQKDIDKLRVGMTKKQVLYVLGHPVVQDAFDDNTWYYVYSMKRGMTGKHFRKEMKIEFTDDKVAKVEGDMKLSKDFNTPLEQ